jgi:signal transduction histidine kinase
MSFKTLNILVVEQNPQLVARLQQLLADASGGLRCHLERAHCLQAALERVTQGAIDVVFLGLSLPDGPGLDAMLKMLTHAPSLTIVLLVEAEQEALAVGALQKGAADYVVTTRLERDQLLRVLRYVTERRWLLAELEQSTRFLQASEAGFQQMICDNADGIVVVDDQGRICFVNPSAESLFGKTAKALIGQTVFDFPLVSGQTKEFVIYRVGQSTNTVEVRVVDTVWEGQHAFLASLRDISERKRVERLKDEFVNTVSHDLRTPLTSVKGAITLMLNRALGDVTEEQQDFLKLVIHDIDRLTEMINNLLDLSKMQAGKMVLTRHRLDLTELIEQALRSYQTILGQRKIVRNFSKAPMVYADGHRIIQVLANLLGNAIKFTAATGTITCRLTAQEKAVTVTIADDGPGIPKEQLSKLFQKFEQLAESSAERPKGTGLGLAICKEIVELHQGTVSVDSDLGHGSAFTFTLPLLEPATALAQLFEETKSAAAFEQGVFGLMLIDLKDVMDRLDHQPVGAIEDALRHCEKTIREHLSRKDRLVALEPSLLVVLAITEPRQFQTIQKRLEGVYQQWFSQVVGADGPAEFRCAWAAYPQDGSQADSLLERARAGLEADRQDQTHHQIPFNQKTAAKGSNPQGTHG